MVYRIIKILICIVLVSATASICFGQPLHIFEGGDNSGYASEENSHSGPHLFEGGDLSGYGFLTGVPNNKYLFEGGSLSGYNSKKVIDGNYLFEGGHLSGYSSYENIHDSKYLFEGGDLSGYAFFNFIQPFTWTGVIGQSWTVPGNWNFNFIPGIRRKVIIPVVEPGNFYPHINAGLFAIGSNPNNGLYKCRELWIQEGALLVTRINNRVENYGLITIDGEMRIKRDAANAFKNFEEGKILVNTLGLFTFDD